MRAHVKALLILAMLFLLPLITAAENGDSEQQTDDSVSKVLVSGYELDITINVLEDDTPLLKIPDAESEVVRFAKAGEEFEVSTFISDYYLVADPESNSFVYIRIEDCEEKAPEGTEGDEIPTPFIINPDDLAADYGDTYTPEELAAIDRALWAANMTRADMTYKKDYTKGHGCFPIVKEMMHDPLTIAPWMDSWAATFRTEPYSHSRAYEILALTNWMYTPITDVEEPLQLTDSLPKSADLPTPAELPEIIANDLARCLADGFATYEYTEEELALLRAELPAAMAWHSFEQTAEVGYNESKGIAQQELYSLANRTDINYPNKSLEDTRKMLNRFTPHQVMENLTILALSINWGEFELAQPLYHDTPYGRICIGTMGDDYYEGDFVVLIEPGGNDTYHNCRIGAAYGEATPELGDGRIGYFLDLGGDDFYDCADVNITLGAAVLGVAAFYDLGGGDDRYYAGSCSLGAAMGGIATFYDDGGCDYYSGKVYTQGAAGFGIGIMIDDSVADAPEFDTAEGNDAVIDSYETGESEVDTHSLMDNDYYTAWSNAQAFARPRGVALCINRRGNETYYAGGVYLHAPLFSDRYQSFSQGFAIGERGIDWAGGIAMLIDYSGNDKYLGDIYNQGVGYWYGAGLLWDGGGNDLYEMTQYGQGSGIHLAIGGLVDAGGNDTYVMHSGLGQGGSHDLAASILQDRGGDDRYDGNTSCNGSALTGSVGIFLDRSGSDTYAGKHDSINVGDNRRINIGLFVDLDGTDDYMAPDMADATQWTHTNIGMGIDIMPPPQLEEAAEEAPAEVEVEESTVPIPEICYYEGELTQEVFDELWEIAIRWEVGDNRFIVPEGRRRLTEFGADVLPYMSEVMNESNSGLAYRAYVDILGALHENYPEEVYSVLRENAASGDSERETAALYLTGELKYIELEDMVVGFLEHEDPSKVRRAIGVLGSIGSHAADENLIDLLDPERNDEPMIKAALTTLTDLEVDCYEQLRPLLAYPLLSVRGELVKQLAAHWEVYGEAVESDLRNRIIAADVMSTAVETRIPVDLEVIGTAIVFGAADASGVSSDIDVLDLEAQADTRRIRSLLDCLTKIDSPVSDMTRTIVTSYLGSDDWGVRADAVRVIRHWQELAAENPEFEGDLSHAVAEVEEMLANETDPYVLFAAGK